MCRFMFFQVAPGALVSTALDLVYTDAGVMWALAVQSLDLG